MRIPFDTTIRSIAVKGRSGLVATMMMRHEQSFRAAYFKQSFLPAARSSIDSRTRRSRVSGRLAV
jgi:hypothetical protein